MSLENQIEYTVIWVIQVQTLNSLKTFSHLTKNIIQEK